MNILWLVLLPGVLSVKLSASENEQLKRECGYSLLDKHPFSPRFISVGDPVPAGELPFVAALTMRFESTVIAGDKMFIFGNAAIHPFCTGVQISSRHILTAAHCIQNVTGVEIYDHEGNTVCNITSPIVQKDLKDMVVIVSSRCATDERDKESCWFNEPFYKPAKIHVHPRYYGCDAAYDLALIELKHKVSSEHGKPICMPDPQEPIGPHLAAAGYGVDSSNNYSPGLQKVQYSQAYAHDQKIIAHSPIQSLCEGDSGGPLFQMNREGKHILFGIASLGLGPKGTKDLCLPGKRNIFADVRAQLEWICDKTGVCPIAKTTKDDIIYEDDYEYKPDPDYTPDDMNQ